MFDSRVSIAKDILIIDRIIIKNLLDQPQRSTVRFAFRTGSTARGDFAIAPDGTLVSDIEYLIICGAKERKQLPINKIRGEIDQLFRFHGLINPGLVEISFSSPLGAWLRRRSYFFFEAIHEGVWLVGEEQRKAAFLSSSLSMHFVNFTLVTRIYDLAVATESLYCHESIQSLPLDAIYKVAKVARHLCTMAYYRDYNSYCPHAEREQYIYDLHPEYRDYLEYPLRWSRSIYRGDADALTIGSASRSYELLLGFIACYIKNESRYRRWPIGRASFIERVRDAVLRSDDKLMGFIDTSASFRKLVTDYLACLQDQNYMMLPLLERQFSIIVGKY